jgi:ABC-type nitrate/sulfonate/bicarbonate transport system substrate-binding protein
MQLKVGTFTKSLLIHIAREAGRFAVAGLNIVEVSVPSSPAQFESMASGELDLAITNPDNVIAYRYLAANPLKRNLNVKILGALDRGLGVCLYLSPNYQSIDQIPNPTFAVDVPQSGFALVGYRLLENLGLSPDEYTIQILGSTPKRATALINGSCDVTILNAGNEMRAVANGCTKLASVTDLGPYIGTVIAAIASPTGLFKAGVLDFAAILGETIQDIKDGKFRPELVNAAMQLLGLTSSQAAQHYEVVMDPENGLIYAGKIDRSSMKTIIGLRQRYLPTNELNLVLDSLDDLVVHKNL